MGRFIEMANKVKSLTPKRISDELLVIIKKHETIATNLNTDQLFQGEDAKGKKLPNYSDRSVQVFGKPSGPMRLFETGSFYRGFFIRAEKFPAVFESSDLKTGHIADLLASKGHNPDDIYGLQKDNITDFARSYVLEDLQKFLRDFIRV